MGGTQQRKSRRNQQRRIIDRVVGVVDRQEGNRRDRRRKQGDAAVEEGFGHEVEEPHRDNAEHGDQDSGH